MRYLSLIILLFCTYYISSSQNLVELSDQEKQLFVQAHNAYRRQVGSPPLQWSDELEDYAKRWALFMAKTKKFQHSPEGKYGENIFKSTSRPTPGYVVQSWAAEKQYYRGEAISLDNYWIFGHYTQIIWMTTEKVGCAMAKDAAGIYYVVCEYSPPGNIIGKKPVENYGLRGLK